jgi:hypothetical protein
MRDDETGFGIKEKKDRRERLTGYTPTFEE